MSYNSYNYGSNSSSIGGGGCGNSVVLPLIFGAIGYFVYGQIGAGFLGIFLYALTLSIITLVGFFPFIGPFLYLWLGNMVGVKILSAVALSATTLTAFIFWWYFAITLVFAIIVLVLIAIKIK